MGSTPGYEIGKDESGMTAREREIMNLVIEGHTQSVIARQIGVSRQRVSEIVRRLVDEGRIVKMGRAVVLDARKKGGADD